jgi:hypothetical protein
MEREQVKVACYSGRSYAERPTAFIWEGAEHKVRDIEREWLEPGEKHFRLRTEDDRLFELCYYEKGDRWSVIEWVSKSEKGRKR